MKVVDPAGLPPTRRGQAPFSSREFLIPPTIGKRRAFAKRERGTTEGKTNKQT